MIKQYQTGRFLIIYDLNYRITQYSQNKSIVTKDGFTTQCLATCAGDMACRGAYVRHTANLRFCTLMHDLGTCTPSTMESVPLYLDTVDESESWYRANQVDTPTPAGCVTTTTTTPATVSTLSVGGYGYVLAARGLGIDPSTASETEAIRRYQSGRFHSFIYDTDPAVRIEQFKHNKTTFNKDEFTTLCLTQCSAYTANTTTCRGAYVRHTTGGNRVCTLLQDLGTCTPSMMETVPLFLSTTDESESWWLSGQVNPAMCSL